MRQIFEAKGFTGSGLQGAVEIVTADRERWIRFMLSSRSLVQLHGGSIAVSSDGPGR